jgi:competence protein ComEA
MTADKLDKFWLLATFLLIIIIIVSAVLIRNGNDRGRPIELVSSQPDAHIGSVSVEGAVANPGIYQLKTGDTLDAVIQAAGGTADAADLSRISLYIPGAGENKKAQLIDLNRADLWLLCSLPDIGKVKAQAIIDYRQEHGLFNDIHEVTGVPGLGESTFEKIKNLITVTP